MEIIFIPGLLCNNLVWGELNKLRNTFSCYDADTTGFSTIEEISNNIFQQVKEHKELIVIGFSMGGSVAIDLALKMGNKVKKLILINTTCNVVDPATIENRQKAISLAEQDKMNKVLEMSKDFCYFAPQKEWLDLGKKMAEAVGAEAYIRQQHVIMSRKDYSHLIEQIESETLIVSSKQDKILPYQDSVFMFEKMPLANLVLFSQCGHFSLLEKGNSIFNIVSNFLKG